jgi:hypothetical protein
MVNSISLVDVLSIPGVDREVLDYLHLIDVARLATTCKALRIRPLEWMLDREILIQLRCPKDLQKRILDERTPLQVQASSRAVKPQVSTSIWGALKLIMVDSPLKHCYGLELRIQSPAVHCQLNFSNEVFVTCTTSLLLNLGITPAPISHQNQMALNACANPRVAVSGGSSPTRYYYVKGRYKHGSYFCNACLTNNIFVKLRKIRQHPGSCAVWNGTTTTFS